MPSGGNSSTFYVWKISSISISPNLLYTEGSIAWEQYGLNIRERTAASIPSGRPSLKVVLPTERPRTSTIGIGLRLDLADVRRP